jgi:hypothetical protein
VIVCICHRHTPHQVDVGHVQVQQLPRPQLGVAQQQRSPLTTVIEIVRSLSFPDTFAATFEKPTTLDMRMSMGGFRRQSGGGFLAVVSRALSGCDPPAEMLWS